MTLARGVVASRGRRRGASFGRLLTVDVQLLQTDLRDVVLRVERVDVIVVGRVGVVRVRVLAVAAHVAGIRRRRVVAGVLIRAVVILIVIGRRLVAQDAVVV